jgi:hypothetical protein
MPRTHPNPSWIRPHGFLPEVAATTRRGKDLGAGPCFCGYVVPAIRHVPGPMPSRRESRSLRLPAGHCLRVPLRMQTGNPPPPPPPPPPEGHLPVEHALSRSPNEDRSDVQVLILQNWLGVCVRPGGGGGAGIGKCWPPSVPGNLTCEPTGIKLRRCHCPRTCASALLETGRVWVGVHGPRGVWEEGACASNWRTTVNPRPHIKAG